MIAKLCNFMFFAGYFYNIFATSQCWFPGSPAHGSVTFTDKTLKNGTIASYYCERGFELLGPARRICVDRKWIPDGIPFCVLNVAAGKAPMQISTDSSGNPQKAIDGSTSAFFSPGTCSLTNPEKDAWWYVNLLEPYMVQLVRLDFGSSCCGDGKPATVIVRVGNNRPDLGTNPICNRFTGSIEEGQPLFLPCNPPMPGAFVSVHLEFEKTTQLSICEAFVYTDQALPIERCPSFRDQPPGALASFNGKCYIFYNRQPLNFREALSFCQSRGGTLISESNPALQGFISWELWRRHRNDLSSQYWLGAIRDVKKQNVWKWVNGEEVSVSFWNRPDGKEDCAYFDGSKGWLWNDRNCITPLNFICQHQPKACGRPEQPPNSTILVETGFEVGAKIEYVCDEGHLLVGPSTRTCLDTGFYNEFPPVCKSIECGLPASIPNGFYELINNSVSYSSKVVYKCNEGFKILGQSVLSCDMDERWNGPPPSCQIVECDTLPGNYYNTVIHAPNGTVFKSVVDISCPAGYYLEGSKTLVCMSNGQWSHPLARCIKDSQIALTPSTSNKPKNTSVTLTRGITKGETTNKISPIKLKPGHTRIEYTTTYIGPTNTITTQTTPQLKVRPVKDFSSVKPSHNSSLEEPSKNNEIINNVNIKKVYAQNVNTPYSTENQEESEAQSVILNLGAIVALGAFGGFVFLVTVITIVIILVRRSRTAQHYRHRASPDCNTVASFDSSTSGSQNGLNRYYRQAWENLHESTSKASGQNALRRKETLDPCNMIKSAEILERSGRDYGQEAIGVQDGSEIIVSDVRVKGEKRRHHHHHKNHRSELPVDNFRREHRHSNHHY